MTNIDILATLRKFMGGMQLAATVLATRGEEGKHFRDKMRDMAGLITTMPKTYEQDGKGLQAVAHLHYFRGGGDWYITERDIEADQQQAFGLACPFGDEGELGYISIVELIQNHVELDLYWTPQTLAQIREEKGARV